MDDFDFTSKGGESTTPFDELRTIARNLIVNTIEGFDWEDILPMVRFVVVDDEDAATVVRLMKSARIVVTT